MSLFGACASQLIAMNCDKLEVLETEMTEGLGARKGQRSPERVGYRAGYYERSLITRVGRIELKVPQDRDGRFSTP